MNNHMASSSLEDRRLEMRGRATAVGLKNDAYVACCGTGATVGFRVLRLLSSFVPSLWSAGKDRGAEDDGRDTEITFSYLR